MTMTPWNGYSDLLSRIEDLEMHLLSWGVVDGHLSEEDVLDAIGAQLDADLDRDPTLIPPSAQECLDRLVATGLLHRIPNTATYRTRLAETLRLLRSLRQLLPPRDSEPALGWWRQGSSLVSDYRLRVSPRRYPARTVPLDAVLDVLGASGDWTPERAAVVRSMLGTDLLAQFQVDATRTILGYLASGQSGAAIVTAGTGSGKTRSFYLPAMIDIAASHATKRSGPHTLALYPRNELLRDQAREAMRVAEGIGPLAGPGTRHARIGLLYGNTPYNANDPQHGKVHYGWKAVSQGWESPYFPCLDDDCLSPLIWTTVDRKQGMERLTCPACGATTTPGAIAMTRDSIRKNPPDILFSTTEMLSKHSTSSLATVLGWAGHNGTRLVLLDEVHTYSGVSGAQVGLMLRRWQQAMQVTQGANAPRPVFVGLSATLKNAGDFMATLTGVDRARIEAIAPAIEDMLPASREYGLVLRGDPTSGASLLSTTIQTTMLLSRMLDNKPGLFGSVTFAFTDDLDVINRLHDALQDAEGHNPYGMARGTNLAQLRSPMHPQASARYAEGQSWDLPNALGRMGRKMLVARTSSQDTGVDNQADVIVATSSLEVGFNDPRVGTVIQHKAPRDMASFLQRRGRAGRRLAMRPLTAVVLSDYGRDRLAYQSYEQLLEPEISRRSLPIGNRFVLKIQATHSLLDWLRRRTKTDTRRLLGAPQLKPGQQAPDASKIITLLTDVLDNADLLRDLTLHLKRALQIDEEEVSALLWEEPRSLMLSVVPTALRRLESRWTPMGDNGDPGGSDRDPLPEFMTRALFEPLNTPDVEFILPFNRNEPERMPIAQALREAVPGRFSRRYGHQHALDATWLPLPAAGNLLPLTDIVARGRALGTWEVDGQEYLVVRPYALTLQKPGREVQQQSQAMPVWHTLFEYTRSTLVDVDVPRPSVWSTFISSVGFGLHVTGSPLTVRRMTTGSTGELVIKEGFKHTRTPIEVQYTHEGKDAALGYELQVDGIVVKGSLIEVRDGLRTYAHSPAWRTAAFKQMVLEDPDLDGIANTFQRIWLVEVYKHAHVSRGLDLDDPKALAATLSNGAWATDMSAFLAASYRAEIDGDTEARLLTGLKDLASRTTVRRVIEKHGSLLSSGDPSIVTQELLDRVFADSIGAALLTAAEALLPDAQENDLTVDISVDSATDRFTVHLTETSIGGLGLVESLHREYVQDPRTFWEAVARATAPTEAEEVDVSLQTLLRDLTAPDSVYRPHVAAFRAAETISKMDSSLDALVEAWTLHEGPPSHLLVSSIAARFLRPGSSPQVDATIARLTQQWMDQEERLGVEIDARTLVHLIESGRLPGGLGSLTSDMVFSMLWLRGEAARAQNLQHWHPFRTNVLVDRLAIESAIGDPGTSVDVTADDWVQAYVDAMEAEGRVTLLAPFRARTSVARALRRVAVEPLDRNGLRVYGRVTGVTQVKGHVQVSVSLAEELQ
ncbi:protein DpdJ [Nocardioides yefusunii]|uniref:Protein DpdJ n=1 Tax=Nocardioides yefusunii TaxID=2500546 RepID=A0ABW1QZ06_9ACTN|nr:protein DpdJ [Nocardioides yefusunii]